MEFALSTYGKFVLIDDEDFDVVNLHSWHAHTANGSTTKFYARTWIRNKLIFMHRFILGVNDAKIIVDHKDRNGLNNQRSNLRQVTHVQNLWNRSRQERKFSKYIGVTNKKYKNSVYWQAIISKENKPMYLGCFKTEEEAALAYNKAALEIRGEFANLNVIL